MKNLDKIVRKNILQLTPYSSARNEFKGNADVFLDANENPFGALNRYPDPMQSALKKELANQKNINPEQIFVGNGSDEVIDLLFRIFCYPSLDNVIAFYPSYGMYEVGADINDTTLNYIPLDSNFDIDEDLLFSTVNERTKIIFICSPNNPTGNCVPLEKIERICNNFNGVVLIDEAYIDFACLPSSIDLINKCDNLIISQTFSKARGLAAARVGYAMANKAIIELFNKVKPPYNISSLNQEAALKALLDRETYTKQVELILEERKSLIVKLEQIDIVSTVYPSEANFLLVEFNNADEVYDYLVSQGIITRNRNQYVANCIRITIGSNEENNKLITTLINYTS